MERNQYIVEGLNSENIKVKVEKALEKIDSVSGVSFDLGRGCVEIIYNNPEVSEAIRDCIERTGHPIN